MDELSNLNTIEKNSRKGGAGAQNFDLEHDVDNQQFTVSDAFYTANDMNNNGFTAHFNPDNRNVYLSIQPNDESVSYKGREGYDKGKKFTSTTMSELLEKVDLEGKLELVEVGEKEGRTFYRVENQTEQDQTETEEITEEVAVEDTPSQETVTSDINETATTN